MKNIRYICMTLCVASFLLVITGCNVKPNAKKTEIVWVTDSMIKSGDMKPFEELNKLLARKGYNFTVKIEPVLNMHKSYVSQVKKLRKSGRQVDLLFSENGGWNPEQTYFINVRDGNYISLEPYFKTANGQKLRKAIGDAYWLGSAVNGVHYGIPIQEVVYANGWEYDKKIADKCGIAKEQLKAALWDLEDVFKKVAESGKIPSSYGIFFPNYLSADNCGDYDMITDAVGVLIDDKKARAVSIYHDSTAIKWITTIARYKDKGYIKDVNILHCFLWSSGGILQAGDKGIQDPYDAQETRIAYRADPVITSEMMQRAYNGIASWSKHKNEAFQLLVLANTDPEIANLLAYGIKGINYTVKDGYCKMLSNNKYCSNYATTMFPNNLIIYKDSPLLKGIDYNAINASAKKSPILGFFFDDSNVKKEVANTNAIVGKYSASLWNGEEANAEETLAKMQRELKTAGIDKVVDEANRQIATWKSAKK